MIPLPFDPLELPMIAAPKGLWRPFMLSAKEANFERRGFAEICPEQRRRLETIGETFIAGYNAGLLAKDIMSLRADVARVPQFFRGFAAEGGAMGVSLRDALSPLRKPLLPALIAEFDKDYAYLVHVGCGWTMARLPWRRRAIPKALNTLIAWLAYDGMGFHDTYFRPQRVIPSWRRINRGYCARAYDQGIGRALWFVCAGAVENAVHTIDRFDAERQGDIWAGLGLAMAYAGGCNEADFEAALRAAGLNAANYAQGVAFAIEAHAHAGVPPECAELGAQIVWNKSASSVSKLVRTASIGLHAGKSELPDYEIWRQRLSSRFVIPDSEAAE